jgi:ATP/maltotriose-dependent transcriptional regulator MalT
MGFGKSVLVSEWLSDLRTDGEAVLLVSAERPNHRSGALWESISSGIEPFVARDTFGGRSSRWSNHPAPRCTSPAALVALLNTMTEPLTLVIDDFEQVRDPEVTHELVRMTRDCELLHLVLVGRVTIGIDDLPERTSPDTILSEVDLTLTPSETATMLSSANPTLSDADFAAAHQRLYGWPLATAALAGYLSNNPSQINLAEATAAAGTKASRDLAVAVGVDQQWLGIASMAGELNLEIATLLLAGQDGRTQDGSDEHDAAMLLDRLECNGVLCAPDLAYGGGWQASSWSPTLRRVIRGDFVRRHRARASEIDAVMANWYVAHDAPGPSITHAARAGQWDLLLSLLKSHSTSLLEGDFQEFSRAIATAPQEVIANTAHGAAWRSMAFDLPIDPRSTSSPRLLTREEAAAIGRSSSSREKAQEEFWQHILYRRRGLFDQARIAIDNAKSIIEEGIIAGTDGVVGLQSLVLTHSGFLHAVLGDFRTALGGLLEAHKQAPFSELSYTAAEVAGKAAMCCAMMGDLPNANVWLGRDAVAPGGHRSVTPYVRSAGLIA